MNKVHVSTCMLLDLFGGISTVHATSCGSKKIASMNGFRRMGNAHPDVMVIG